MVQHFMSAVLLVTSPTLHHDRRDASRARKRALRHSHSRSPPTQVNLISFETPPCRGIACSTRNRAHVTRSLLFPFLTFGCRETSYGIQLTVFSLLLSKTSPLQSPSPVFQVLSVWSSRKTTQKHFPGFSSQEPCDRLALFCFGDPTVYTSHCCELYSLPSQVLPCTSLYWSLLLFPGSTTSRLNILKERRRETGRGSEMGAWHQDRLADWPSGVI
jgi:hypothetical protein